MNSSLSSTLFWLDQQRFQRPSEQTLQILESIELHTNNLVSCLLPVFRPDYCHTGKDAPFRLLEMLEFEVMRSILEGLVSRGMVRSAIWLHDGVWISPPPDPEVLSMLEQSVLRKTGLICDQPFIRLTSLSAPFARLRQSVNSDLPVAEPKFRTFVKWFKKDKQPFAVIFGRIVTMINPEGRDKHRRRRKQKVRRGIFRPKKVISNMSFRK